jgi:hypothetical protein
MKECDIQWPVRVYMYFLLMYYYYYIVVIVIVVSAIILIPSSSTCILSLYCISILLIQVRHIM